MHFVYQYLVYIISLNKYSADWILGHNKILPFTHAQSMHLFTVYIIHSAKICNISNYTLSPLLYTSLKKASYHSYTDIPHSFLFPFYIIYNSISQVLTQQLRWQSTLTALMEAVEELWCLLWMFPASSEMVRLSKSYLNTQLGEKLTSSMCKQAAARNNCNHVVLTPAGVVQCPAWVKHTNTFIIQEIAYLIKKHMSFSAQ